MRRQLLPALLLLVAVAAAFVGLLPAAEVPVPPPAPPVPTGPPVLTARRVPALLAAPVGERRLVEALDALWHDTSQTSCLSVSDGERVLFERSATTPVIPASTLKLVTATAVLHRFDAGDRIRTVVRTAAPPAGGVVEGDLFLVGGGDPVLGTAAFAASFDHQPALVTPLETLADRVVQAGVREVRGAVVGDESRYDQQRYRPTWPDRYRVAVEIGPMSALTVDDGLVEFGPRRVPFPDPAAGAADVFGQLLRERGVVVTGSPRAGLSPATPELTGIDSPTMGELVGAMLKDSDNGTAELLVKELGAREVGEGSTDAGLRVVMGSLVELGLPTTGITLLDGSGLDRGNTVTCDLLVSVLDRAEDDGSVVDTGLAVAGTSGTLSGRFVGRPSAGLVRAKTGALNGVAGLAGYATSATGDDLVFAYLLNGITGFPQAAPLQVRLADTLVASPELPSLDGLGPEGWPASS